MKEISIEEKAKLYDEAIERAKKWYNAPNVDKIPTFGNRVIEEIFPELKESKESEDERIIKHLIKHFGNKSKEDWNGVPVKSILAWLEKQGEKGTKGNEREIPNLEPPLTIKHAKEVMGIKQDDAWSEEDEKMLECAIDMIEWYSVVDKSKSRRVSDWFKSLKDRYTWKPSDEQMYNLSEAAHYRTEFWDCDILIGLYDELNKLK